MLRTAACAIFVLLVVPSPGSAQIRVDPALTLADRYMDRGLLLAPGGVAVLEAALAAGSNRTDLQLDAGVTVPLRSTPPAVPPFRDLFATATLGVELAGVRLESGFGGNLFIESGRALAGASTVEWYATLAPAAVPGLSAAIMLDLGAVGGGYGEVGFERELAALHVPLLLAAHVGVSAGQASGAAANYERDGVTHVGLAVALPLRVARVALVPGLDVQWNADPATWTGDAQQRRHTAWLSFAIAPMPREPLP